MSTVDVRNFIYTLPAQERLALARELLDSIQEDESLWRLDDDFAAEVQRRKEDMLRGEQITPDWRTTMEEVRQSLK